MHLACEYNMAPIVENIIRILTTPSTSDAEEGSVTTTLTDVLETRDRKGFRALHHCAVSDSVNTGKHLLDLLVHTIPYLSTDTICMVSIPMFSHLK